MLEVKLEGHNKYYCVSDVVRLFYDGLCEDKDRGVVINIPMACSLLLF